MDALREEQRHANGPTREDLGNQTAALRKLRALSANLATERERLDELSSRIAAEPPISRIKSLPLLILGLLFFLGGAGMSARATAPTARAATTKTTRITKPQRVFTADRGCALVQCVIRILK